MDRNGQIWVIVWLPFLEKYVQIKYYKFLYLK